MWRVRVYVATRNPIKTSTLNEGGCNIDPKVHHSGGGDPYMKSVRLPAAFFTPGPNVKRAASN